MSSSDVRNRKDGAAIDEAEAIASNDTTHPLMDNVSKPASKPGPTLRQPPPEEPSHITRRSFIVASFWLLVLCLGLPVWWNTTSIYRANLPVSQMMDWADGKACSPVFPMRIVLAAPTLSDQEARDLLSLTQDALDNMTEFPGKRLRLELPKIPTSPKEKMDDRNIALTVQLNPGDSAAATLHAHLPILEVTYITGLGATSPQLAGYIANHLRATFDEEQAIMSYFLDSSSTTSDEQKQASYRGADPSLSKRMTRSMKYSGTYHLTFSLFTSGPSPSSWDIDAAIEQYMRPVLNMLNPIHNFTIDTQVQLYATPGVQSQILSKEDLSSFVNAAEWPLSPSIGGAPTINFVVFMGNQTIGLDSAGEMSQSWLVPQWGSVYLLQPPAASHVPADFLKQPVLTFASHLLSLLGTPKSGTLATRLSTLTRVRSVDMLLRASSSLGSLARLSLALPSISIPSSVADGVSKSMHHLELACSTLGSTESLEHARIAETEAERAFFEKGMVSQLYFPDEHKIAVYLPLLGPVGVPLVMSLLAEIRAWKARRAGKAKAE
ncbi:phosphatidylinositol-glycan biosynthesis class S protein [Xylariaceae sp. FL1272]|nr:phosphatidylinositol-glycan biosynthesis class S protein [Xylariaceae sp. FL1272]